MILSSDNISNKLLNIINSTPIFDLHTHLFPPKHEGYFLLGFKNLLNYHYLIAELLTAANIDASTFYSYNDEKKASLIWNELFEKRTPVSEACAGVLSILKELNIEINNKSFLSICDEYDRKIQSDKNILDLSNVSSLVMTNNPFDLDEWSLFDTNDWDKKIYLASLRLDDLILDYEEALKKAKDQTSNQETTIVTYLEKCYSQSNPVYVAVSLNLETFHTIFEDSFWKDILVWLENKNLPLSLMLGVKRAVNKDFGLAGDGIGDINLKELSNLCNLFPNNKFLVTCLSLNDQHELIVLARKHPNLRIFGFWWFMNQPTIIKQILKMRIDMLGFSFIPQHSDARVSDQLIYKWSHFKKILHPILLEYYQELLDKNFPISENILQRDIDNLLSGNAKKYLGIT
ncbi:glucuronate isomerase [Alphaproteobacteria bacterium]|nr:glucuronate isomerase [Alphaproteobacteria bacterium]